MKLNENKELWVQRVEEFKSSNLNQTTWCEENEVNVSSLRYWLKKLDSNSWLLNNVRTVDIGVFKALLSYN